MAVGLVIQAKAMKEMYIKALPGVEGFVWGVQFNAFHFHHFTHLPVLTTAHNNTFCPNPWPLN